MGRLKKPILIPKCGIYLVDRRIKSFLLYKKIISRQVSKNTPHIAFILVKPQPALTTIFMVNAIYFFGKLYLKVLVTTEQECVTGFIPIKDFSKLVRSYVKWEYFG